MMATKNGMLFGLVIAAGLPAVTAQAPGVTTRYWDCCKPSCSWNYKANFTRPVLTCAADGFTVQPDTNIQSGCTGGTAYSCTNNMPWAVTDTFSFGFAAAVLSGKTENDWCCACYLLTFTSGPIIGKQLMVQITNTGGDLGNNHFDLQMPGGGVGMFNGCSSQWNASTDGWGVRYGGVTSREQCLILPPQLQPGCFWRYDWFGGADNPTITMQRYQCPTELKSKTQCTRYDDASQPVFTVPTGKSPSPASPSRSPSPKASPLPSASRSPVPSPVPSKSRSANRSPSPRSGSRSPSPRSPSRRPSASPSPSTSFSPKPSPTMCDCGPFPFNAWNLNLVSLGDIGSVTKRFDSEMQGGVAALGNSWLTQLNVISQPLYTGGGLYFSGGNFNLMYGTISHGGVEAKGAVHLESMYCNGNIVAGGDLTGGSGSIAGSVTLGGTCVYCNNGGGVQGAKQEGVPFQSTLNLGQLKAYFLCVTNKLGAQASTITFQNTNGAITINAAAGQRSFVTIPASTLSSTKTITIIGTATSELVINVPDIAVQLPDLMWSYQGVTKGKVLLNMPSATTLSIAGWSHQVVLLAPLATVTYSGGFTGNLVVGNMQKGTGVGAVYNAFQNLLDLPCQCSCTGTAAAQQIARREVVIETEESKAEAKLSSFPLFLVPCGIAGLLLGAVYVLMSLKKRDSVAASSLLNDF